MFKKTFIFCAVLLCCATGALLISSCSQEKEMPLAIDQENNTAPTIKKAASFDELRGYFNELARNMAQQAPQVIEKILASEKMLAAKGQTGFDELDLAAGFSPNYSMPLYGTSRDVRLKTTLERAEPCKVNPASKDGAIIFAPDPHVFQPDEREHICAGWLAENGKVRAVEFTVAEYEANYSNVPLYTVGYKEMDSIAPAKATTLAAKTSATTYAACVGIYLQDDHDDWNDEEFEVYLKIPNQKVYEDQTTHIFDGATRKDARGVNKEYPDINDDYDVFVAVDEIAFFALDGQDRGISQIENDNKDGQHQRSTGLCSHGWPCAIQNSTDVGTPTSVNWDVNRTYKFYNFYGINSDDIIDDAFEDITLSSLQNSPGLSYKQMVMDDMGYRLKKVQ